MYLYEKQWPSDEENGWSEELNGVCHDSSNWYFTQNKNLWKFPLSYNLSDTCKKPDASKGIYRNSWGYPMGDIDYCNGYVFVPVTGNGDPYIAVFKSSDLSFVCKQSLTRFDRNYSSIGWCAVNPQDNCLYTSDRDIKNEFNENCSPVMVYTIRFDRIKAGSTNFLTYKTYLAIYDEKATRLECEYVQGGCFDNMNRLHISNGQWTSASHNYANEKGGITVFRVPKISSASRYNIYRIAHSNQSKGFRYQFDGTGEEPQGITYWDFSGQKVPGDLCGVLHCIMLDNAGVGDDDFYFKHYKLDSSYKIPSIRRTKKKRGIIITTCRGDASSLERNRRGDNRDLMSGLFTKRGIDYTIVVDHDLSSLQKIIKSVFTRSSESESDVDYIYINCHGGREDSDGVKPVLCLGSDYDISYSSLKQVFAPYTCKKVFLLDTCHAGSAVDLLDTNNYILCSTLADANAYGDTVFGNWATRYWSAGAGNDFIAGAEDDLEADENGDKEITLMELCTYTNEKLKKWSRPQQCVQYPVNSEMVIFD